MGRMLTQQSSSGVGEGGKCFIRLLGGSGVTEVVFPPLSVLLAGAQLPEELLAFGEEAPLLLAVCRGRGGVSHGGARLHSIWMRVGHLGPTLRYLQSVYLGVGGVIQ